MKKLQTISSAALLAATLIFSGCGESENAAESGFQVSSPESAKQVLYTYGSATNDHYALFTDSGTILDRNDNNVTTLELNTSEERRLFVFRDPGTDNNESTNTDKVLMFKMDPLALDRNVTYEDFYYLDHIEGPDALHAHAAIEFNETNTSSPEYLAMVRLNEFIAEQRELKANLESNLTAIDSGATLCNFYTVEEHHEEDGHEHEEIFHYVLDATGVLYKFEDDNGSISIATYGDNNDSQIEGVSTNGICSAEKSGMSKAAEGVLVLLGGDEQKLFLVDAHGDAKMHVHSTWDVGEVIGNGVSLDMMVGMGDIDVEIDHSDHDHE